MYLDSVILAEPNKNYVRNGRSYIDKNNDADIKVYNSEIQAIVCEAENKGFI